MPSRRLQSKSPLRETQHNTGRRNATVILVLTLLVGGTLRLVNLRQSPPGLNQDEAANAWNAYCLLKTGHDQAGKPWPVFYSRCLGVNSSTLFLYWMIPFQALGGLNVWTTRLPAAVAGTITLILIYYVGGRMFGRSAGLAAAALMAVNPWHIQQCRWGHEASFCPLLVAATLAAILWANLPLDDDDRRQPRPLLAALAGIAAGISCYGYPATRAFLPLFLAVSVLVTWSAWRRQLKTRNGRLALGAFVIAGGVTFGPLVWKHLTDGGGIGKQFRQTHVWNDQDPTYKKAMSVLARYPGHFGPGFLFLHGDPDELQSPPGSGQFQLYMLPLMLLGLTVLVKRLRSSPAARVLLAAVLLYPVGDCISEAAGMHALRSLPGLCGLILLAAVGTTASAAWLRARYRRTAMVAVALLGTVAIGSTAGFAYRFFGECPRRPYIYHSLHVDLIEACEWLRPRLADFDAVFCTGDGMNMPYVITLVALQYDPAQWFRDPRDVFDVEGYDFYRRYGKMRFMYDDAARTELRDMERNGRPDRILFIVRPDVTGLGVPIHEIRRPDGEVVLKLYKHSI